MKTNKLKHKRIKNIKDILKVCLSKDYAIDIDDLITKYNQQKEVANGRQKTRT